jgi:hypothetical protein
MEDKNRRRRVKGRQGLTAVFLKIDGFSRTLEQLKFIQRMTENQARQYEGALI